MSMCSIYLRYLSDLQLPNCQAAKADKMYTAWGGTMKWMWVCKALLSNFYFSHNFNNQVVSLELLSPFIFRIFSIPTTWLFCSLAAFLLICGGPKIRGNLYFRHTISMKTKCKREMKCGKVGRLYPDYSSFTVHHPSPFQLLQALATDLFKKVISLKRISFDHMNFSYCERGRSSFHE